MHPFESHLAADWQRWSTHGIVVAVSGGADSVALLSAYAALRREAPPPQPRVVVAHYNHGWRGAESDDDQQFVQELARTRQLAFFAGRGKGPANVGGQGAEATARRERYAFLLSVAEQAGARYIATAHTAEDQVETVLHRILRGTGIDGLGGIPRLRRLSLDVALVRPLLAKKRTEIRQYLSEIGESFRCDRTNDDRRFMRNRIRHELLPELRANYQPDVDQALLRLAADARDYIHALGLILASERPGVVQLQGRSLLFQRRAFQRLHSLIQRLLLRQLWREMQWPQQNMTRERWHEVANAIADGPATKQQLPGNLFLIVDQTTAVLERSTS